MAFTRIAQLRNDAAFGGWLRTITVRLAMNLSQRRRCLRQVDSQTLHDCYGHEQTAEKAALADERRKIIRERLKGLRELDRETLSAFYLGGQSLREMSDRFDARVGTIKRRLFDARQRLAVEMEDYASA
jgi:RNA polymerase sigma-70 factor (ECF subfamily)